MEGKSNYYALLFVIIAVGLFLRLYHLDQESFWTDEAFSVHHASEKNVGSVIQNVKLTEGAPPGYYLLLHFWIKMFGDTEFSTRLLSTIFGTGSIIIIYALAAALFNHRTALLSSLFIATSMLQVLYSQEARMYIMFTFFSLLSTLLFAKIYLLEKEGKFSVMYYAAYIAAMLLSFYTNYMALFLLVGYTFFLLWRWEKSKPWFARWAFANTFVLLISLPLVPLFVNRFVIHGALPEHLMQLGVPSVVAQLGSFMFALPMIMLSILLLVALLFRKKIKNLWGKQSLNQLGDDKGNKKNKDYCIFAVLLFFSVIYLYLTKNTLTIFGIPVLKTPLIYSYFLIRHSFFLAPVLYVSFAYAIAQCSSKKIMAALLILLLAVNAISLDSYYRETTKTQWKEAAAFIQEHSTGKPLVLLDRGGGSNVFLLNYYSGAQLQIINLTKIEGRNTLIKTDPEKLFKALEKESTFWLVLSGNSYSKEYYKEIMDKQYTLINSGEFYQIKAYKYSNFKKDNLK